MTSSNIGDAGRAVADLSEAQIETHLGAILGPVGEPTSMLVELGAVRRMAITMEDFDPIHFDDAAAKRRGYRGIVAPWPLLWSYFFNCTEYHLDLPFGKATVHGQDDYELHEPMIVGDLVTVSTAIVSAKLKRGRSGLLGQVESERRFTNQNGQLCAVLTTTLFRR